MRQPGATIQDLWYSTVSGRPDLTKPTARKGRGKRYRLNIVDLQGGQSTEHFATKKQAQDRQGELNARMLTGAYASRAAGRTEFSSVAEDWYANKRIRVKAKTLEGYRSLLDIHVLPKWGTATVGITWQAVQKWVVELVEKNAANRSGKLSASRILQAYHVFRAVMNHAVRMKMIAVNPATDIDLPRKPTPRQRHLTHQQVADVAMKCDQHGVLVLVLSYCGLRWGEAVALTRADIDLERSRIAVERAVTKVGRQYLVGPTKTHETRSVPVPATVLNLLRTRIEKRAADKLVFPGSDGYLRPHEFRKEFDPAVAAIGVPGLVPHELRHTCASLAIRGAGADVKAVQTLLGHKTATMTLDLYGGLFKGDLDAVAVRLDAGCVYPLRTEDV